jgi:L-threonylcarbamoyladenylate synthase
VTASDLDELQEALLAGSVVAVPTDTVYGLAVDPRVPGAVGRLFASKRRPDLLALPVLIAEPTELADLAEITPTATRLAALFWPGPLTMVLRRRPWIAFELGGDPATIGIRCPANSIVRELLRRTGPLAVTSANLHGETPLHSPAEVREHFGTGVSLVLDGGRCDGVPSTVVSLLGPDPECLREGGLPFAEIAAAASRDVPRTGR